MIACEKSAINDQIECREERDWCYGVLLECFDKMFCSFITDFIASETKCCKCLGKMKKEFSNRK